MATTEYPENVEVLFDNVSGYTKGDVCPFNMLAQDDKGRDYLLGVGAVIPSDAEITTKGGLAVVDAAVKAAVAAKDERILYLNDNCQRLSDNCDRIQGEKVAAEKDHAEAIDAKDKEIEGHLATIAQRDAEIVKLNKTIKKLDV